MDAAAELGRNPVSKHQIQPEYGDEQDDCRTRLASPNSQARTRTGKNSFFLFSRSTCEVKFSGERRNANGDREKNIFRVKLTMSRIGNLTRLILTLDIICNGHTSYSSRSLPEHLNNGAAHYNIVIVWPHNI